MNKITIMKCQRHHLDDVLMLWNTPQVMNYVGFPEGLKTDIHQVETWFKNLRQDSDECEYVIFHEDLGFCGETYFKIEGKRAILDIKLLPKAWGQKIASDSLSYCLNEVFKHHRDVRAVVDPHVDNIAANHLYLTLGFKRAEQSDEPNHINYELTWERFKPSAHFLEDALDLHPISKSDLPRVWELGYKEDDYPWHATNGPYFGHSQGISYEKFLETKADNELGCSSQMGIYYNQKYIGSVSYYYESEVTRWLEMGIIIEDQSFWSKGISTLVFKRWMSHLFKILPIDRVGFATWSGNPQMIRVGQKCGMKNEGKIRHVRYYQEIYYDSIKFGMTRKEFETLNQIDRACHLVKNPEEKRKLCLNLLRENPKSFGIESSIIDYSHDVEKMHVITYQDKGFIALNEVQDKVLEIHVMAISPFHHHKGIGSLLVQAAIFTAREKGCHTLLVKTLDESHPSKAYQVARNFYKACGFHPLLSEPSIWGKENPCLIMIQSL